MFYRFGDFELSEEDFSLSRDGRRLPLEPRALCVLLVLVKSPNKLLDKKVLLETVWQNTFVEETTLTRAIAVIRKQLGDDPRQPSYIETVPTRGYRFIAVVTEQAPSELPEDAAAPAPLTAPVADAIKTRAEDIQSDSDVSSALIAQSSVRRRFTLNRKPVTLAVAASGVVACALAPYLLSHHRHATQLSTKDTLVLADFTNTTGDPAFDVTLRQGLLVQLEQSPVLRIASDNQIRKTLKRMGHAESEPVTTQVGQELCQRLGGSVVLDGTITKLGNAFVLGLRARRCSSGEELDAEQVQIARKEDALEALTSIATRFRGRLGEASATLHDFDTPLAEATTPSLEALNAFSHGMQAFNTKGSSAALPLFRYATELDPNFAWAHAWLGRMYADLGNEAMAVESTRRAYDLRDRASERERLTIAVSYDLLVTGNLETARSACDAWLQMYPRDIYPRAFLSATVYPAYGQYERALNEAQQMIALDPDFVVGYRNAAMSLIALNRVADAEATLNQAFQRKVFLPSFVTDAYRIAFLKGDVAAMQQALNTAPKNPWLLYYHAATLARSGKLKQAQGLRDRAVRLAEENARRDMEAELLVTAAFTDVLYGYPEKATQQIQTALRLPIGRYAKASAALVLAMAGHVNESASLVDELRRQFPEDTVLRYNSLPTAEAAIALWRNKPQDALEALESTSRFGVSLPLYPVYLRGKAHLALGHTAQAAAEFHLLIDHPGLVLNDPLLNVARLDLAKAYTSSGDRGRALELLQTVRREWSGAEEEFPALSQMEQETQVR